MKAISFKIPSSQSSSLRVQIDEAERFYDKLHFHPEYQITAILKGEGLLFMGNSFTQFSEGDVFLLGSNVSHLLKNSQEYYEENSPGVLAISLFFTQGSLGEDFFILPEMEEAKKLLHKSFRGIKLSNESTQDIFGKIVECKTLAGLPLIAQFLQILDQLSHSNLDFINDQTFSVLSTEHWKDNMDQVIDYSTKKMNSTISLEDVAKVANLSISQFSKRFKSKTNKTYIQFLNELRVETACTLLRNSSFSIQQISLEVGFSNLANFNRQFKKIKGQSPSNYRNQMRP